MRTFNVSEMVTSELLGISAGEEELGMEKIYLAKALEIWCC
jgi:hypothetical protein